MVESNRFTADGVETEETLQHTLAGFTDNAAVATPAQPDIPHTHSLGLDEDWLRLAFVALPATRCHMVLARWQNPTALMEAVRRGQEAELLATPGITPPTIDRLREAATRDLKQAYAAMETHNIRLLRETDEEYPVALHGISDPPPYLFIRGNVAAQDEVAVAIVGTRHATEYGRGVAAKLAEDLAQRGITVVSGMARGIDTAAHRGALQGRGRTFAVCGCGLDIIYPSDNKQLMEEIERQGAAFSEFAPTVHPEPWHFPARNRIISGLSAGVIVVEAGERSGALITTDFALEQSREIFAVPGNIYKPQSRGTHSLIKQGATLIDSVDDVIGALNNRTLPFLNAQTQEFPSSTAANKEAARAQPTPVRADLTPIENRVYAVLEVEPRHVDELAALTELGAAEVNATLVMLELKGAARRLPGGMFARIT